MARMLTPELVLELRRKLPAHAFSPAPQRLLWLPFHLTLIAGGLVLLAHGLPLGARLLVSLVLGLAFGGLAFVAHEALHGALVRSPRLLRAVGFVGFAPFCLSPRLWIAWHNRTHHGAANHAGVDPDALLTLDEYRQKPGARFFTNVQRLSRGILTLLVGFTVQSAHVLLVARHRGYLNPKNARLSYLSSAATCAAWLSLGFLGLDVLVYGYLLPLVVANGIVMAHILTNHGLSPLDDEGDPLRSALTVRVPRWFSFYTLDFGYHVEHHLLPGVSHRYGRDIQALLRELAPERYQELPFGTALYRVLGAPRVYGDAETLVDPLTGARQKTLGARSPSLPPRPPSQYPRNERHPLLRPRSV